MFSVRGEEVADYMNTTDPTLASKVINSWLEKKGYDTTFDQAWAIG